MCRLNCSRRYVYSQSIEPQDGGNENSVVSLLDYLNTYRHTYNYVWYSLYHTLVPEHDLDGASPVVRIGEVRVKVAEWF